MQLLEKALANIYGNYMAVEGGTLTGYLTDLTGALTEVNTAGTFSDWWDLLLEWNQKNYLTYATTTKIPDVHGLSFAITEFHDLSRGRRLIKLKVNFFSIDHCVFPT